MSKPTGPQPPAPERDDDRQRTRRGRRGGRGRRGPGSRPPRPETADVPRPEGDLVLVRFKGNRKAGYHNAAGVELTVGDYCLVEADRGRDLGRVCYVGPGREDWWDEAGQRGVVQRARPEDLRRLHENRADEWQDYDICLEKIQEHRLDMQLVTVERQFDRNKITFYFTAEKRVDFRLLVKDLAGIFRTRIDLRQIGVRDEAKIKGGLGLCGRELCCSTFLTGFSPVTLKMAKAQQLPMSPNKLSGLCGRLRCCLAYEHESYAQALKRMPRVGARVRCERGGGRVRKVNILQETVLISLEDTSEFLTLPLADLSWDRREDLPAPRRGGGGRGCGGDGRPC